MNPNGGGAMGGLPPPPAEPLGAVSETTAHPQASAHSVIPFGCHGNHALWGLAHWGGNTLSRGSAWGRADCPPLLIPP